MASDLFANSRVHLCSGGMHVLQRQRGKPAEERHGVVGDDDVPGLLTECSLHGGGCLDPLKRQVITAPKLRPFDMGVFQMS